MRLVGIANGEAESYPYHVNLSIPGSLSDHRIKVWSSPREDYLLLGRDVVNLLSIHLDGPNLSFSFLEATAATPEELTLDEV